MTLLPQTILAMKNILFFAILLGYSFSLHAQKTATWKGGTPGRPTEWNCATNWKEGRVPNEFSQVIIPDVSSSTFSNPVLSSGDVEIWSLQILSGATLNIGKSASLIATGQDSRAFMASREGEVRQEPTAESLVFVAVR
jgi:hypothetical protein